MNISYKWLKRYIGLDLDPHQLTQALTSIGLESDHVEEVESVRGGLKGLVAGHVLTCEPHPDSDHLHVTTVDLGAGEPVQIVCGAPNVAAGQTVIVAPVGTTLYAPDGKEFKIKRSKIRGVESLGMICAEDEIGIGSSHDGIIVIDPALEVKPGTPAAEHYRLSSDYVIEIDLTPNRVDAASHYGVARDLAAWAACHREGAPLSRPSVEAFAVDRPGSEGAVRVRVEDYEACPRYSGLTIRGVEVKESPDWLKECLTAIGQRPINNVVDITNFILHGFGQPMHAFDAARISGGEVVVRKARQGEKFTTLDGVERTLDARDLMICNAESPMCIAGVFGGQDSGVKTGTTDIFLESAYFNPTSVRKTARRHGLSTDASFRYERGCDPAITLYTLRLAALMVKELAGGEIVGEPVDLYPRPIEPARVTLSYAYLDKLVGTPIPADTVDAICTSLEMKITGRREGEVDLEIPTYRVDVTRPCDVVEDVLRIYGYNNVIPGQRLHASIQHATVTDRRRALTAAIIAELTARGFNEIMCNSLTAERYYADNDAWPADHCVRLLNPLSADLSVMRQTLLYGGLEAVERNVNRRLPDLMLVEAGNVYTLDPTRQSTAEAPLAPYTEKSRLALWMTGSLHEPNWVRGAQEATVYDVKATVESILDRLGISPREVKWEQGSHPALGPVLTLATRSGKPLGFLGSVGKATLRMMDVKQPVHYAELEWEPLTDLALKRNVTFSALPKTHPVKRDLALLVDTAVTMAAVKQAVEEAERKMLREVTLFDVYEGKNLPAGKKSYAISLTLQDGDNTLTDKQIDAAMNRIVANLSKKLGAELR